MSYDEAAKQRTLKYRKKSQHTVSLAYKQDEYDNDIAPAIKKSGKPVATFIKEAVREKIDREGLA